nr:MAG TPA: hypothetical protein [Caudoviricetes sp.]
MNYSIKVSVCQIRRSRCGHFSVIKDLFAAIRPRQEHSPKANLASVHPLARMIQCG